MIISMCFKTRTYIKIKRKQKESSVSLKISIYCITTSRQRMLI